MAAITLGRFAFGWSRFGPVSSAVPRHRSSRSVWFSWPLAFRCEDHADERWMDFLGFTRQNIDFSMGYEPRSGELFTHAFPWRSKRNNGRNHADGQDSSG